MFERMSIDEYAAYERENGARLCKADGIWWREVRPFFYRTLFPFQRLEAKRPGIPRYRSLLGYQHLIAEPARANSKMNFFVLDDVQDYHIGRLGGKLRWAINRAKKDAEVRPISDLREFVEAGFPVYLSFFERTDYHWRSDRSDKRVFRRWAETLYRYPQMRIMGCYIGSELNAITISHLVEDVVFYATLLCNAQGLKARASDLMLHDIREAAARYDGVKYIFMGSPGNRSGLDLFKTRRKCKLLSEPARFRLNPLVELFLKRFNPEDYGKLKGDLVHA